MCSLHEGSGIGGCGQGEYRSSVDAREPQHLTKTLKSEEYQKHLQGVLYSTRGSQTSKTLVTNVVNIPGFPGASSVCNVLVPWTNPSPARGAGVQCGTAKGPL
eukprot:654875-Pyramimonas_sp.AAC.1